MAKGKKQSEPKHHPNRDQAYFDKAPYQHEKWQEEYLDPVNLRPPHEEEREQRRDAKLINPPDETVS